MNFKNHVTYAIEKLTTVGGGHNLFYTSGCGVTPPDDLIAEVAHDMDGVKATTGQWSLTTATSISAHSQWARWGLNTFDPTVSLTAGLMITTPTSEPGFPMMPYPAFFVRVPRGFIPFWPTDSDGTAEAEPRWIEGLLVSKLRRAGCDEPDGVLCIDMLGPPDRLFPDIERILSVRIFEDAFVSPAEFVKLDDDCWNDPVQILSEQHEDSHGLAVTNRDLITKRLAFRLIANLCSWLESTGGMSNRKPSNCPRKSKRNNDGWDGLEARASIVQWIVGQEVKLSHELIESAKAHVLGLDGKRKGWNLTTKHTVRGHIRHQACGPRHSERKVIWIEPFVRGPADGDVVAHVYKAKEKENTK